ncbi:DUF4270 domain-containing protein [Tamlana sp. I1]|uniref:DUF4270 domain-containing protein n=1 Tax=Tamlana sp. I1 TaxID=2762061 RepID=UPI00188E4AB8|nr:DUF4270 domain-containing protein [Tamlana sp. I1]
MKKTFKTLKFPIICILFVCVFIACDKDYNVLDSDVLGDENANFKTNDSLFPVLAYNKKLDSLQINRLGSTAAATSVNNLLGVYKDPAYGLTKASIVAQIVPNTYNPNFGESPVVDSVVFTIPYYNTLVEYDTDSNPVYRLDSLFGNTDASIKLTVYRSDYFLRDYDPNNTDGTVQNYFSNGSSTVNTALNGTSVIRFDDHIVDVNTPIFEDDDFVPSNSPIVTTVGEDDEAVSTTSTPAFRELLDNDYWKATIIDKQDDPVLSNANNFKNYFRGLYFKAEANSADGNMILLNLSSTNSNITIYYTSGEENSRTQGNYVLNFSGNLNILNTYVNEYTIPLANGDKVLGDEELHLKGTEGSMAVVELFSGKVDCDGDGIVDMDAIDCFKQTYRQTDDDGNYVKNPLTQRFLLKKLINEAQLILTEKDNLPTDGSEDFHKYDRIYAYNIEDNSTTIDYTIDQTKNTADPLNSNIISLGQRDSDGKFKIRLTEYLTNILHTDSIKDETPTKLGLVLSNNVNYTDTAEILESQDEVTAVPRASILSPRGTIIYGTNQAVPADNQLQLKIFYSEAK